MAKYTVNKIDATQWAVCNGTGSKYYNDTVSENEQKVRATAVMWEMQHHYNKACALYQEGVDAGLLDDGCMGDYLC